MGGATYTVLSRGLRIRAYPSGKRVYQIEFRYQGIRCPETFDIPITSNNETFLRNKLGAIHNEIKLGAFNYQAHFPDSPRAKVFGHAVSTVTVGGLLDSWLGDVKRSHPHSTAWAYEKSVRRLKSALGMYRANDLAKNPEPIKAWIRGREVTLKTIRNDLTPLRAIFDQAVTDNQVERNPLDKIKVKRLADAQRKSDYKVDPYSLDEILLLLQTADKHRPEWRPYWQYAFFSGLRPSEQYALQWSKIDWVAETVHIDMATVERHRKSPKTISSEATIPILPKAGIALRDQQALTGAWSEYVFVNPRTERRIRDYEETSAVLKYLCRKAGIRYRMQKQTRHSFASNLLEGGESPPRVAELLRHKTVEMLFRVYAKSIEKGKSKGRKYESAFANLEEKRWRDGNAGKG